MKPAAFALLLIAAVPTAALSKPRPTLVPPGWTEVYKDAATRTRRFKSPDGAVTLTARQTAVRGSREADLDEIAFRPGETITYQRRGRSWIAVSGYRGDDIFYRKSNLACGGTRWNNIEFIYPRADKKRLDAIVTRVASGMTRYGGDCS
jgi:serine/threonine-protein kinase